MKARQLKARDVKLWITLFKSALKSERSNSGRASRWRKEVKLKTGESCTAESEETVAGTGGKKGRKPFSAFVFQMRKSRRETFKPQLLF